MRTDVHGKPPFKGRPGRPLPSLAGLLEHVVEVVGDPGARELVDELGHALFDPVERASCQLPSGQRCGIRDAVGRDRWRAWPRATGEAGTSRSRSGSRAPLPRQATAARGSSAGRRPRASSGVETPERHVEQLAIGDGRSVVADDRSVDRRQLDLDRLPTTAPQCVDARSHDEAPQPGFEPIGVAQGRQVSPGGDEALLDRVSRELVVPEDQSGCRVQPRDGRAGEHGEGVMIAPPRTLDELSLVHGHPL